MDYYVYIAVAFVLGIGATFLFDRLGKYTVISVYEVSNDMVPIEREVLEEIISEYPVETPNARSQRIRVRLDLDAIQVRLHRILSNAKRPKYWALTDRRVNRQNKIEHPPEVAEGIKKILQAERELWWLTTRLLVRIWLWNVSGFHIRTWGPIPDVRRFHIQEILDAYNKVKVAAIELARSCGEGVIAEEIATAM